MARVAVSTALIAAVFSAAGCGTTSLPSRPTEARIAPEVLNLRVYLDGNVSMAISGSVKAGFDVELRETVRNGIVTSGLAVTSGPEIPHDLVARVEARLDGGTLLVSGRTTLTVESDGAIVEVVTTDWELHRWSEFPRAMARHLVAGMLYSPKLAALARQKAAARTPAAPAPEPSRPDAVEKARQHAKQGTSYYNLDRFAEALPEYEAAYLAMPDPALLYNIAQCHRMMGRKPEALSYYRKYLREAPNAPNRSDVEKRIGELEQR